MEADPTKAYDQDAATGFIRLKPLRLKVAARRRGKSANRALVNAKTDAKIKP